MLDNSPDTSLTQRLRERISKCTQAQTSGHSFDSNTDNLLFMGNWHDAIPRALILDPILQSTDKCVYLLLRTYMSALGASRMPSYDEIGHLLSLSRGTIARCLHILRAARWITLCNTLRYDTTGRFKGNIYAIHDEVLSIQEAMVLDGRYIEALEELEQNHKHHRVRMVAYAVLENLRTELNQEEPDQFIGNHHRPVISRFLDGSALSPTNNKNDIRVQKPDSVYPVQNFHSDNHPVHFLNLDSENTKKQSLTKHTQKLDTEDKNLDSANPVRSSSCINKNIKTTTTSPPVEINQNDKAKFHKQAIDPNLIWPSMLTGDARWVSWQALRKCPVEHQQDLLDELAARMLPSSKNPIKNPSAWLAWASKELREDGIYPITNLAIIHRQLREREQQRRLADEVKQQGLMMNERPQQLKQASNSSKEAYKRHLATLKTTIQKNNEA
jgi:uncharacterized protein (DUF2267 family)